MHPFLSWPVQCGRANHACQNLPPRTHNSSWWVHRNTKVRTFYLNGKSWLFAAGHIAIASRLITQHSSKLINTDLWAEMPAILVYVYLINGGLPCPSMWVRQWTHNLRKRKTVTVTPCGVTDKNVEPVGKDTAISQSVYPFSLKLLPFSHFLSKSICNTGSECALENSHFCYWEDFLKYVFWLLKKISHLFRVLSMKSQKFKNSN